jgi:phosphate acetyltransferase
MTQDESAGKSLISELRTDAVRSPGKIALPDSDDIRIFKAADQMLSEGSAARIVLMGARDELLGKASAQGIDLARHGDRLQVTPVNAGDTALGMAADMLCAGDVDAVVAGNISTTAQVIRAGISGVGLAPGVRTVSGSFIMNKDGQASYLYADCGVVIAPTEKQLLDIAAESVRTWRCVFPRVEPVVAFLSFSTKGSATHELQEKTAQVAAKFRELMPDVDSDGEMQFDAAFDATIGHAKAPGSKVPGRANCFIFPDLNAGNIAYKITQRLAGFDAYGPILQGLAKPFCDLSRGSTVADIVASSYINLRKARI